MIRAALVASTAALALSGAAHAQTANPKLWPGAASPAAMTDPATEARVRELLAKMTIEEKVGQTIQADITYIKPEDLKIYPLGSLLAGGSSGPFGDERGDAAKWLAMVSTFRAAAADTQPATRGPGAHSGATARGSGPNT